VPETKGKKKKKSVGTGRYVFCPMSNQGPGHHVLFALEVQRKESTGNLWTRCICGTRIQFDHGKLPGMTEAAARAAGATFPFMG